MMTSKSFYEDRNGVTKRCPKCGHMAHVQEFTYKSPSATKVIDGKTSHYELTLEDGSIAKKSKPFSPVEMDALLNGREVEGVEIVRPKPKRQRKQKGTE